MSVFVVVSRVRWYYRLSRRLSLIFSTMYLGSVSRSMCIVLLGICSSMAFAMVLEKLAEKLSMFCFDYI